MNVVFILGVVALFEVAQADPKCPDGAKIYGKYITINLGYVLCNF